MSENDVSKAVVAMGALSCKMDSLESIRAYRNVLGEIAQKLRALDHRAGYGTKDQAVIRIQQELARSVLIELAEWLVIMVDG